MQFKWLKWQDILLYLSINVHTIELFHMNYEAIGHDAYAVFYMDLLQ